MRQEKIYSNLPWLILLVIFGLGVLLSSCSSSGKAMQVVTHKKTIEKIATRDFNREVTTRDSLYRLPGWKIDTIAILDVVRIAPANDSVNPYAKDSFSIQPVVVEKKVKNARVRATITSGNSLHLECETDSLEVLVEQYRKEVVRLQTENSLIASEKQVCPPCPARKQVHWTYTASRWIVIIIIILLFIGAGTGSLLSRIKRVVFGVWKI